MPGSGPGDYRTPCDHEAEIRRAFEALPERALTELASSTLAVVLDETAADMGLWRSFDDPSRLQAAMVGGIRAFRAVRAGMAMLANGYEMEADTMSRVLLELYVETRAAVDDLSGDAARSWLGGRRGRGISGRVRAAMPERPATYGELSRAAHGDPRALVGLAVANADGHTVEWGPRQTAATGRCLLGYAIGARDMAVLIEEVTARRLPVLGSLDETLSGSVRGWQPDRDWTGAQNTSREAST